MDNLAVFENWLTSLLDGRTTIVLFFSLTIISLIFASIILEYHWRKYGAEIRSVKTVRAIYFLGALFIASLLTVALYPLI
jgi:hypothetical protein